MGTHQHFGALQIDDVDGLRAELSAPTPATIMDNARGNYRDVLPLFPRWLCANATTMVGTSGAATGTIFACGGYAPFGGVASKLKVGTVGASAGTGSVRLAVYRGASPAALTRYAVTNFSSIGANSEGQLTFPTPMTWNEDDYLCAMLLGTGFSTMPTFEALVGGGPGSTQMSTFGAGAPAYGARAKLAATLTGQSDLPASADITTWPTLGTPFWWALGDAANS